MITLGIDIGSTMTKSLVLKDGQVYASKIVETGAEHKKLAYQILLETLSEVNLAPHEVDFIVGTGYGRLNIPFADKQLTEITCHAKGVAHLFPECKTVIEIGGQDSKVIKLVNGKVDSFAMNDKCAAGTGRFLQTIADTLDLDLNQMNEMACNAKEKLSVSNICAVFAKQEIISALSLGYCAESILAGMYEGFARKVLTLANTQTLEKEVVLTGGTTKHKAFKQAFESIIGCPVLQPEEPLLTGALGAALIAANKASKMSKEEIDALKRNRLDKDLIQL